MRLVKIIPAAAVIGLIFLLIRQNSDVLNQPCQFKLNLGLVTFQSVSHPLWVIVGFALFLGILGTGLYSLSSVLRLSKENRQLRHELTIIKSELETSEPLMESSVAAGPVSPSLDSDGKPL